MVYMYSYVRSMRELVSRDREPHCGRGLTAARAAYYTQYTPWTIYYLMRVGASAQNEFTVYKLIIDPNIFYSA